MRTKSLASDFCLKSYKYILLIFFLEKLHIAKMGKIKIVCKHTILIFYFCKIFYWCNFLKIKQKPCFRDFAIFSFCENILVFNFCLLILQSRNTRTKHENVTGNQNGEVAQLVEASDWKSVCRRFESALYLKPSQIRPEGFCVRWDSKWDSEIKC